MSRINYWGKAKSKNLIFRPFFIGVERFFVRGVKIALNLSRRSFTVTFFWQKKFSSKIFNAWANSFCTFCETFSTNQNCILCMCPGEIFEKKLFNLKSCLVFLLLLHNERKHFGKLVKKIAELAITSFFVSIRRYWGKANSKNLFFRAFLSELKYVSLRASKLYCTCLEDLFREFF